jgi:FkbM family methyltransferase
MALNRWAGHPWAGIRVGLYDLRFDLSDHFELVMAVGEHQNATLNAIGRILRAGDTYVDVGAHIGYLAAHAGSALGPEGQMLLFEPDPRTHRRLAEHLRSATGGQGPKVILYEEGLSDEEGVAPFHLDGRPGGSSFLAERLKIDGVRGESVERRMTTFDQALDSAGIKRVRLVKIDAEGYDIRVARGMSRFLSESRVDFLIIEQSTFTLEVTGYAPHHFHALLSRHNYVGAHEDGRPVCIESLESTVREDPIYARSEEVMREIHPNFSAVREDESDMRRMGGWAEEAATAGHPNVRVRRLILEARRGDLDLAIAEGCDLLREFPELTEFRGHVAHWIEKVGRIDEARQAYERLLETDPTDETVRRKLGTL